MSEFDGFTGYVPIFPLPNVVLFPHGALPLHIFEPRYREMVEDALRSQKLIAMALLKPGWEAEYYGKPEVFETVCIGRIANEQRLVDGRFNLVLVGVRRARVIEEAKTTKPYRVVRVELVSDVNDRPWPGDVPDDQRKILSNALQQLMPNMKIEAGVSLGTVLDVLAGSPMLDLSLKRQLLVEADVPTRLQVLLRRLADLAGSSLRRVPTRVSLN